jgi:hypothetical protein
MEEERLPKIIRFQVTSGSRGSLFHDDGNMPDGF